MTENVQLHQQIERLRGQMVETAALHNTLFDGEVLQISQSLDLLIVRVQEERLTRLRK
ncbi:aspartyl-phosphate phosphatase Spo0E family protein [Paenibacillus pasadenensis]|uniref:aspartyl-phosphate phosphatase Spo0E family protein n=1 Tax=Paenibacillus pasadenensis TaxID=217090 RepID=UPI00203C4B8A|nr:aspartyl-phosphate phosphatase Spo0E family protein [Paenibacillus pasadenensis]MCM3747339.1 aspartyl-phosphate phosphatase Spo0E family protein [Paenibacillus pasadenensis]